MNPSVPLSSGQLLWISLRPQLFMEVEHPQAGCQLALSLHCSHDEAQFEAKTEHNMTCSPATHYYYVCQTIYTPAGSRKNTLLHVQTDRNLSMQSTQTSTQTHKGTCGWTHVRDNGIRHTDARCISLCIKFLYNRGHTKAMDTRSSINRKIKM